TATSDAETNAHFTRDQKHIYFTRGGNLYVMSLETGSLVQMTEITTGGSGTPQVAGGGGLGAGGGDGEGGGRGGRKGQTPRKKRTCSEQKGTESQEYLKKEERELLDIVKRRAEKREQDDEKRKREHPRKPFQLNGQQTAINMQLTPDEKYVIATVSEQGTGSKNTIVPNYVTETSYTKDIGSRPKVGDTQNRLRLAIVAIDTGEVKWVDHGQKLAQPPVEKAETDQRERGPQVSGTRSGQGPR